MSYLILRSVCALITRICALIYGYYYEIVIGNGMKNRRVHEVKLIKFSLTFR